MYRQATKRVFDRISYKSKLCVCMFLSANTWAIDNGERWRTNRKITSIECFGSIRRNRSLSVGCRSSSKGPRGYANTGGWKKNYGKVLNDREQTSPWVESLYFYACLCAGIGRCWRGRGSGKRKRHEATLCRVGDLEWQRVRDFQVGMQISHSRMSRGFDSV